MAQPAVPPSHLGKLPLPRAEERGADLGLTLDDRERLAGRIQADPECLRVRVYRFDGDDQSPMGKMTAAQELLGAPVMTFVPLTPGTPGQHSTLTGDHKDPADVADVRTFLLERLGSS